MDKLFGHRGVGPLKGLRLPGTLPGSRSARGSQGCSHEEHGRYTHRHIYIELAKQGWKDREEDRANGGGSGMNLPAAGTVAVPLLTAMDWAVAAHGFEKAPASGWGAFVNIKETGQPYRTAPR